VPIAGEPLGPPEVYGNDRVFCYIRTKSGISDDIEGRLAALEKAGHPVLRSVLRDPLDLGEEFFIWEFATAVAGSIMGIDAFDQPNVQESKDNTKRLLAEFTQRGAFPQQEVIVTDGALRVFSDDNNLAALRRGSSGSLADVLAEHLRRVRPGDYFALTEYIEESSQYDELIQQLRVAIRKRTGAATTTGYGPRFLHSTGQLHKGGPDSGVFIQMTCEDEKDIEIPGERFTFGALKQAQALGDFQSLSNRNRRAIRVDLGRDVEAGLQRVLDAIRGVVPQEKAKAIA
jgi:transaldolase/glucose-6-phosphate isomerase